MKTFLYAVVELISNIHSRLMGLNDTYALALTDKQLHFLVIGVLGILLVLIVHPIFLHLSKTGHTMVITWIYVFTLLVVITFAIEIGQGATGTGNMEFADIMFGLVGFLAMFTVFQLIRAFFLSIVKKFKKN